MDFILFIICFSILIFDFFELHIIKSRVEKYIVNKKNQFRNHDIGNSSEFKMTSISDFESDMEKYFNQDSTKKNQCKIFFVLNIIALISAIFLTTIDLDYNRIGSMFATIIFLLFIFVLMTFSFMIKIVREFMYSLKFKGNETKIINDESISDKQKISMLKYFRN